MQVMAQLCCLGGDRPSEEEGVGWCLPGSPPGAAPKPLWRAITNAEYRCRSFGDGLVTAMWLWPAKGATSGALEDGDLCVGESTRRTTSRHH